MLVSRINAPGSKWDGAPCPISALVWSTIVFYAIAGIVHYGSLLLGWIVY